MGWHVQVIAPLPVLLENAKLLAQSPVPVVIDHYGVYGESAPGERRGHAACSNLVRHAACLDEAVRAVSARRRADEHAAGPRMGGGALCGRAAALRLGQRLAASARRRSSTRARRAPRRIAICPTTALVDDFIAALAVARARRPDHARQPGAALRFLAAGQRAPAR